MMAQKSLLFAVLATLLTPVFAADIKLPATQAPSAPQISPLDAALAKLKSPNAMERRQGAEELGRLRDPLGVAALNTALADKDAFVRGAAVDALGIMRNSAAKIAELLVKDPDEQVRTQAAISLTYLADPSTEDSLIRALGDASNAVRFASMRTLGNLRSQKAVPTIVKFLDALDVGTRQAAASALERIASRDSLEAVKKASADADPGVRQMAIRGLANIGDPSAKETLKARLTDPAVPVRIQAALALGRFGDSSGLPLGLEMLLNPETLLRQQGSQIVGQLGDEAKGLKALNTAFEKEQDAGTRQMIELARAQLKARLGIREKAPAPAPQPGKAAPPAKAPAAVKPAAPAPKAPAKAPAAPKKKAQ